MHTAETDMCPNFRYVEARVGTILREYAESPLESIVLEAVDLARIITNVIEPLAREAQPPAFAREYHHLAERLFDLSRPWGGKLDPDFPKDRNQSQLILDRIEQLENRLNSLFERKPKRRVA